MTHDYVRVSPPRSRLTAMGVGGYKIHRADCPSLKPLTRTMPCTAADAESAYYVGATCRRCIRERP